MGQLPGLEHKDFTRLDLPAPGGFFVGAEILRKGLFELQGNAFAHYSDGIYGIDQGFYIGRQQIAMLYGNHALSPG